jgi:hypothetical protein
MVAQFVHGHNGSTSAQNFVNQNESAELSHVSHGVA